MLESDIIPYFMIIIIVSIITSSLILFHTQEIKSINLLDLRGKTSEFVGYITKIDENLVMTFHHAPVFGLKYLKGASEGIQIQFYGLNTPSFITAKEKKLRKRILEKMKLDILTQDITVKIRNQNKNFVLLGICETNTLIKRDLGYEYLINGFFSLNYSLEQENSLLFMAYKDAEAYARGNRYGLWELALADEEEDGDISSLVEGSKREREVFF
ncbi:hypothetical protein CDIK_0013 [Cucumispora dikerogammari]|nr:hypothetical protein CDIK_0013 [Cucumispora dikerogammari]